MSNNDLLLGNDHDLSLGHNQPLGLRHNHNLVLSHELVLGHAHDDELALGQNHEHEMALRHAHGHHNHENGFDRVDENGLDMSQNHDPDVDQHHNDVDNHDNELGLTVQNHALSLSENHELALVENHDLDENIELTVSQSGEISIVDASGMTAQHSQLLVSSPVLQSRTVVPAPNHELVVGQEFADVQSCRRALRDTAIALHFEIQTVKSDKTRFTAKCASDGCPWRIHCAKLPGVPTFTIRTIHESHTCGGITHLGHQQASVQWVASSVEQSLKENPHYKPKEILEEIHRVHGITLSYKQAWRGKERIMAAVRGSFEEGYRLLPQYCDQIRRTNPESIALVYANPMDNSFHRLFVSFQASIYGFLNACRPLIGQIPWDIAFCHWF